MNSQHRRENGFVSLLTCIFISMLLMVVTLSMITLETLQLRKAADGEQTLRAYYAAEAGTETGIAMVRSGAVIPSGCIANTAYDATGAAGWTCLQIILSGKPTGKLEKADFAKTIDPGKTNYQSVKVEWDVSTNPSPSYYDASAYLGIFPTGGSWNFAAPIELSIVEYPNGPFRADSASLKLQNVLIVPGGGAAGTFGYLSIPGGGPRLGNCTAPTPGKTYNCTARITGFLSSQNYIFRIRSRYAPSAYRFTFFDSLGPIDVVDGSATIDVTARAGDTYRRVVTKLPAGGGASGGLNYVMYSDGDICKNFTVMSDAVQPGGCP